MENNKSVTSVEWFAEIVSIMGYVSTDILEQAKEMHKQEIIDAYNNGEDRSAELYYNETFKSE